MHKTFKLQVKKRYTGIRPIPTLRFFDSVKTSGVSFKMLKLRQNEKIGSKLRRYLPFRPCRVKARSLHYGAQLRENLKHLKKHNIV